MDDIEARRSILRAELANISKERAKKYRLAYNKKYIPQIRHLRIRQFKDKFGGKCALCDYSGNYASLDFHHLRDKKFAVNTVSMQKPLEMIEEELKKCILICRNCHNDTHYPQFSKDAEKTALKIEKLKGFQ